MNVTIDGTEYAPVKRKEDSCPANPYVIVRSRDQGVMCGRLINIAGRRVTLAEARQIFRYDSLFVLVDVAEYGMRNPGEAMLSAKMSMPCEMLEACGVLHCTDVAAAQLREIPAQVKP